MEPKAPDQRLEALARALWPYLAPRVELMILERLVPPLQNIRGAMEGMEGSLRSTIGEAIRSAVADALQPPPPPDPRRGLRAVEPLSGSTLAAGSEGGQGEAPEPPADPGSVNGS